MSDDQSNELPKKLPTKHDILTDYLLTHLPSYPCTKEQVEWIQHYFEKSPECLKPIVEEIEEILSDGVINVQDIPAIVKCISTLYHKHAMLLDMADLPNLILLVRYTLDCMIDTNLIVTNFFEKKILELVVNSSLDLLQYQFVTVPAPVPEPPIAPSTTIIENRSSPVTIPTENPKDDSCWAILTAFFNPEHSYD